MKFSKMALTLGLVSAMVAGTTQANEKENRRFPLFISGDTFKQVDQASDGIESYSSNSWTVTSQVSRRICVQWDGQFINKQPEAELSVVGKGDEVQAPRGRCIRWETRYSTVNHGKATRYKAYNYSSDRQVIVLQPYYFSLDGTSLATSTFYSMLNATGLASDLRRDGYNVVLYQFKDMNAGIPAAAAGTKALIKELSDNASTDSISVVGLSMGGVVGRYALTQMAYQGTSSKVTNFVSYDAPHLGANIPKSLIDNIRRLEDKIDVPFCGEFSECSQARREIRSILAQMNTKTFKQLVLDAPNAGSERTNIINQINSWGGRPNVPSLAISNGTRSTAPGVPHNKLVTHFKLYRHWLVGGSKYFKVHTNAARDNLPGGMQDFYSVFSTMMEYMPHPITNYVNLDQKHTFVSTNSAIAGSTSRWNRVVYSNTNETHMNINYTKEREVYNWITTYNN